MMGIFLGLSFATTLALGALPASKDQLVWNVTENRVSAEISSWDLTHLLEQITLATSWQVYIEPETQYTVSTKFKDRTPGEALRLLLGNLSFALLPQTNGPSKLFVFRTTLQEATRLIRPVAPKLDPTATPIPNELVVKLKQGEKIDDLAKKLGAKVLGKIDGLNTYRLSFDDADAANAARELLKNETGVESVGSNYWMQRPDLPDALSLSSGFPFNLSPRSSGDSKPIVGLIDTAIQPSGGPLDSFLLPSVSVAEGSAKIPADQPTHGTSMWETMLRGLSMEGTQTGVKILPVDVYGNSPSTSTFDVAHGIVEAINQGATVINLSLGSAGDSELLRDVVKRSSDKVVFFAAAGNEPGTAPTYPAAYPEVLAVTAGTRDGTVASYANHGDFVDMVAPGSSIIPFNGTSWLVTGTSASTAYASGWAAGLLDGGKLTPAQIKEQMPKLLPAKR